MSLAVGARLRSSLIRHRTRGVVVAAVVFVAPAIRAAQAPTAQVTVLKAAQLIDGTGAAPIRPAMIRIEGERIVEVGPSVRIPSGARVVDLGDATLLPGLIDLHTHLTGDERVHWEDALVKSTPVRDALVGSSQRPNHLAGGIHHLPRHGAGLALRRRRAPPRASTTARCRARG